MTDRTLHSTMPAVTKRPAAGPAFRDRMRAEARATWNGRCRWAWRAAAAVLGVTAFALPGDPFNTLAFYVLAILSGVVPAWLCSDLLSIRARENPEPLREWAPEEFAARAVGRLLPFLLAQAAWVGIFVAASLVRRIGAASPGPPGMNDLTIQRWSQLPMWWLAWWAVFPISGLAFAAWAGFLSGSVRRPRRWVVTLITTLVFTHVGTALLSAALREGGGFVANLAHGSWVQVSAIMPPNVWLGVLSARVLLDHWPALARDSWDLSWLCGCASVMWLLYALVPALLTWWIAVRRYGGGTGAREGTA